MIEPIFTELSKDILDTLSANEIIYAEVAEFGAMGNSGGVMLYILEDEEIVCFETNLFIDKNTYIETEELLSKHIVSFKLINKKGDKILFDFYDGGMGNSVFVNKNVSLKIGEEYFIYNKDNLEYQIFSSVQGVYYKVAHTMRNSKNKLNKPGNDI